MSFDYNSIIDYAKKAAQDYKKNFENNKMTSSFKYAEGTMSEKDLNTALFAFAKETLNSYDKEVDGKKDGKISVEEYKSANIDSLLKSEMAMYESCQMEMSAEEQAQVKESYSQAADLAARSVDFNQDGFISVEEEALAYKIADYEDDSFDGKVETNNLDFASSYIMNLNDDTSGIVSKYANGEKLTADETKQLDQIISDGNKAISNKYKKDLATNTVIVSDETQEKESISSTDNTKVQTENKQEEQAQRKVKVDAWGSKPKNGQKHANDCIARIIANNYPEVKLYSKEYNKLVSEIASLNNIKNVNVIRTGSEIILP